MRATKQQRKRERKTDGGGADTVIQLGEGLCETGTGLVYIKACDWLGREKKEYVASCHTYSTDGLGCP